MNSSPPDVSPSIPALAAPESAPSSAGIRLGRIAVIAVLVLIIATAAGLIPRWRARGALRVQTSDLSIPSVIVVSPAPGTVTGALSLTAEVRPFIDAPIYARANGFLKRWLVDLGAKVEAGQLLAEIDTPELNQELARAKAELGQVEAALALAKITSARWVDLLKTSSVSEQEVAEKQSDLALKAATVEAARANVRRLEELQSFGHITAPFSGTITARKADVGELIAAGSAKEIFRLAQTTTLRVFVHVPQMAARSIAVGQLADLTMPELPNHKLSARVVRTSGVMEPQSRTLLVELELDNAEGEVLAGSYAQVQFPHSRTAAAITLPSNTLLFRAEGVQVGVVHSDGTVQLRSVTLGRDFGPTVEVLSGVSPTDRVIVNPSDSLAGGAKVKVAEIANPVAPTPGK